MKIPPRGPAWVAAALAAGLAAGAFLLLRTPGPAPGDHSAAGDGTDLPGSVARATAGGERRPGDGRAPASPGDAEFVSGLRAKFGPVIHIKHAQIKAIEQLIAYLMAQYPDDWQDRVLALLEQLFPDLADELYGKFIALMGYNEWLASNRGRLMAMTADERHAALWAAREAAFGDDAAEIWAAEVRNRKIQDALRDLDASPHLTTDEKLSAFVAAIHDAYGDHAPHLLQARRTELLNNFLDVPAVQDDLRALDGTARAAALRGIRGGLGMDADALQRWEALDRERDARWDAGVSYMAERERILARHQGAEAAARLRALQDSTFGEEAATIRNEEEAGFFRFAHERRIGRE